MSALLVLGLGAVAVALLAFAATFMRAGILGLPVVILLYNNIERIAILSEFQ